MEYVKLKLISFLIVTHVSILSPRGKVRNKKMGFFNFYNWPFLFRVIMSFFIKQQSSIFPF
jgi:hypothetical protein